MFTLKVLLVSFSELDAESKVTIEEGLPLQSDKAKLSVKLYLVELLIVQFD